MIVLFLLDLILLGITVLVVLRIRDKWQRVALFAGGIFNLFCFITTLVYLLITTVDVGEVSAQIAIVVAVFVLGTLGLLGIAKLGKYASSTMKLYSQVNAHKRNPAFASNMRAYTATQRTYVPFQGG